MKNYDKNKPYNNLPPLPPQEDIESKVILRKVITASRALAQLNGMICNLPNPTLFIDTIYLQEAKNSSEIENIVTTNDDLYQTMTTSDENENIATKEVISYKEALWLGLNELKQKPFITTNLCIRIVQCIKKNTASVRSTPGTALKNSFGETIYTPPTGEDVIREKLGNLEKFINEDNDIEPLVKMALMHYQFEAIHPFSDGNGRAGRILLLLYLKMSGLMDTPAIYFSEYIIRNKTEYYQKLRNVTEKGEWEQFIVFMLEMIEETAKQALVTITEISRAMNDLIEQIRTKCPKIYSKELVELFFRLPYIKRQQLVDAKIGNLKTSGSYLAQLAENEILTIKQVGKEKLYINKSLLAILNKVNPELQ